MKKIHLTQDKVAFVDDADFEVINQYKWYAQKDGSTYYARRDFRISKTEKVSVSMHQCLIGIVKERIIDHRNHNGLDNQRFNLRHITNAQNLWNRRKKGRGVRYRSNRKKWESSIWHLGKYIFIGLFKTEYAAEFAYNITKRYLRKEFT